MLLSLISLVIAEAALETVPNEIMRHPSVKKHAQKSGKKPTEILLDRSYHHAAMIQGRLKSEWKRGRPDIIHFALMEALSTPLFFTGMLKVYVSTINNKVIFIGENLRIPKSYFRFEGLMMNLFKDKVIKKEQCNDNSNNNVLLKIYDNVTFESLIKNIVKPDKLIGLSTMGVQHTVEEIVSKNIAKNNNSHCAFVIGGFPKGHFSDNISELFTYLCSIGKSGLEAHVVIARILYECEKALSLSY
jgi:rRNA small subunit pseudouridine methyltransferase Nep1